MAGHDLRSALNAMVGWLHLIESRRAGPVLRARAAAGLEAAVGTQRDVVEAFLHGSRIVNGEVRSAPRRLDVHGIARAAVDRYQPRARSTRVGLTLVPAGREMSWWGDPVLAEAALAALLAHGFTAAARGQALALAVVGAERGASLVLEGCALPAGVPSLLQGPCAGGHAADDLHYGAGLLLCLAGSLAAMMGGRLFASPPVPGATAGWATLQLPAAPVDISAAAWASPRRLVLAHPSAGSASRAASLLADVSVLVVDDRADMREMIEQLLEREGAQVIACGSAAEAIRRHADWASGPGCRLIVSDLSMPDMDGLSLMRVLRARELVLDLPRTPAVALTAQPDAYPPERVAEAGYDLLLGKPVQPGNLIARLSRLVRGPNVNGG